MIEATISQGETEALLLDLAECKQSRSGRQGMGRAIQYEGKRVHLKRH